MHRMTIEQTTAAEQLAAKQSALQENNRLQMDELLKPIKEQFADFKKSVEESKTQNEVKKRIAEYLRGNDETLPAGTAAGCNKSEGADL